MSGDVRERIEDATCWAVWEVASSAARWSVRSGIASAVSFPVRSAAQGLHRPVCLSVDAEVQVGSVITLEVE